MAICSICGNKSFSTYMVERNRPVCKDCMRAAGLLTKFGMVNMKRAIELCGGKPTVDGIRRGIYSTSFAYGKPTGNDYVNGDDISHIDGMDGHDFEFFCAELLRKNGFSDISVTPGSGDQGVDVLAVKGGVRYAVQCKNYSSPLGNTPVQEVTAGKQFYKCHVGVVMTNSTFTPGAVALANATGVLLWDRPVVQEMIENAYEEY